MANTPDAASQPEARPDSPAAATAGGTTTIEDGVVAKIAGIAAREVDGVHTLGGGAARVVGVIRDVLKTADPAQGVSVDVVGTRVTVDVTLVVGYPVALQRVTDEVRAAVSRAMRDLVGMQAVEVNITVKDVHVPSDDDGQAQENEGKTP